ncbi:BLOC-1-related complex subunit 7-like [Dreissena polymorpha]|uniref:BLOC-1-related complex subunit 7-like n=1 Tax=Dreissena polymorpha TaxID=45954 RepID=UPI0022647004|nr:BLOC-1-related complex subunit 7-like [Dreissena polymorpha]
MYSSSWNQETKLKLNDKVSASVNDMGSLLRHVVRSSKSPEMLGQAARNFCSQEHYIQNSSETLMKMGLIKAQFEFQQSAIERSVSSLEEIQDQLKTIQR